MSSSTVAGLRRIIREQAKEIDRLQRDNYAMRQCLEAARLATYGLAPERLFTAGTQRSSK